MYIDKIGEWIKENTYGEHSYEDIPLLCKLKEEKGLKLSVVFPTLEEEGTIGDTLNLVIEKLIKSNKLIDELVVIDGGSKDNTKLICDQYSEYINFHLQSDILSEFNYRGKGEALWKSLSVTKGDIIIFVDSDIKNFTERFITGILAPLLLNEDIKFVKGFYNRPYILSETNKSNEGGRVTELCARPLLNMLYPELSGFIQPLGGEYGGYRNVLENLDFTSGYGVEVQTLIEMLEKYGLSSMAQVNLVERVHRHQPINSLSKMSFAIMQTILKRNIRRDLNKSILIKNLEKENSSFVKSRSEGQVHCNTSGYDMDNNYFKYASIDENILPSLNSLNLKRNTLSL